MPPKGQKNLKVSSTGRVEVVEPDRNQEEMSVKPRKKTTRAKKKVVVEVDSGSDEPSDETDFKECESRLIQVRSLSSLNIFFLVEIDYHLGCRVFGYKDLKTGRFQQRSNYSFKIDVFCDGIKNKYI